MNNIKNSIVYQIKISKQIRDEINELAQALGTTGAALVRTAVNEYITDTREKMIRAKRIMSGYKETAFDKKQRKIQDRIGELENQYDDVITENGRDILVKYDINPVNKEKYISERIDRETLQENVRRGMM